MTRRLRCSLARVLLFYSSLLSRVIWRRIGARDNFRGSARCRGSRERQWLVFAVRTTYSVRYEIPTEIVHSRGGHHASSDSVWSGGDDGHLHPCCLACRSCYTRWQYLGRGQRHKRRPPRECWRPRPQRGPRQRRQRNTNGHGWVVFSHGSPARHLRGRSAGPIRSSHWSLPCGTGSCRPDHFGHGNGGSSPVSPGTFAGRLQPLRVGDGGIHRDCCSCSSRGDHDSGGRRQRRPHGEPFAISQQASS